MWRVPYQPGALSALGYSGGRQVNKAELRTAAVPARLKLSADRTRIRADGQDLSYVTVELVDARGVRHPKAESLVSFALEGPGTVVGVGNAKPVSTESYQRPQRKAWQGKALVVVKAARRPGRITLRVTAQGLPPASIIIDAGRQ